VTGSGTGGVVAGALRSCAIVWQLVSEGLSTSGISLVLVAIGDVVAYVCLGALLGGASGALVGPFSGLLAHWKGEAFRRPLLVISVAMSEAAAVAWCLLTGLLTLDESYGWPQALSMVAAVAVILAAAAGGVRIGRRVADHAWRRS
jgi:hypothetical protein